MRIHNFGVATPVLLVIFILSIRTASPQIATKAFLVSSDTFNVAAIQHTPNITNNLHETDFNQVQSTSVLEMHNNKLSGNWFGVRDDLFSAGFEIDLLYKGDVFANVNEALPNKSRTLDNIDFIISHNLQKSIGLENSKVVVHFLGNSGGAASDLSETCQGISNIEAAPAWKLYQLQFESSFFGEQLSVLIGLYDLNSEFDARESSSMFINPAHGIGTEFALSGLNGPSIFPTTSLGIRIKYQNEDGMYFQSAVLDGVPGNPENPYGTHIALSKNDGLLLTAESGIEFRKDEELEYKFTIGGWRYTSGAQTLNLQRNYEPNPTLQKNYGIYFSAEKKLYTNAYNPDSKIHGFLRIGMANADVNPVDLYFGCGLTFSSLFAETDQFGFAAAYAHSSTHFRATTLYAEGIVVNDFEVILEATYSFQPISWLIIQPDLQYVINPTFCAHKHSSLLFGSRIILTI